MSGKKNISLSNTEWSVMECLWASSPRTIMQLVKAMEDKLGWAKSTTNTMIRRMEAKGFIRYEDGGKARLYYPNFERGAAALEETESFLGRVYGGNLGLMINTLVERQNLSQEEIDELYEILGRAREANRDA